MRASVRGGGAFGRGSDERPEIRFHSFWPRSLIGQIGIELRTRRKRWSHPQNSLKAREGSDPYSLQNSWRRAGMLALSHWWNAWIWVGVTLSWGDFPGVGWIHLPSLKWGSAPCPLMSQLPDWHWPDCHALVRANAARCASCSSAHDRHHRVSVWLGKHHLSVRMSPLHGSLRICLSRLGSPQKDFYMSYS